MTGDDQYIEALETAASMSKSNMAICGAPLALLMTQFRYLAAVEGVWVPLLLTIAVALLFFGLCISWFLASWTSLLLAKEKLVSNGNASGKGFYYLNTMVKEFGGEDRAKAFLTEEGFAASSFRIARAFWLCASLGYVVLFALLIVVIWTPPIL